MAINYKKLRLLIVVISIVLFVVHYLLPDKKIDLYPKDNTLSKLYGYNEPNTGQISRWLNKSTNTWECTYKKAHFYGCGYDLSWNNPHHQGLNLQHYDALELEIDYKGIGPHLRLYTRGYNSSYSTLDFPENNKHMFVVFSTDEIQGKPVRISLSELRVSNWWLIERNVHRQWASPELNNITSLGIEIIDYGHHAMTIKRISLVGRWITTQDLLYGIIVLWMGIFLLEGGSKFISTLKANSATRQIEQALQEKQKKLELEKSHLKELANKDPLTQILNRSGFIYHIKRLALENQSDSAYGLMMIDLDYFKAINDTYGHDTGDKALKIFCKAQVDAMRKVNIFGRWGGEEFILVCPITTPADLSTIAERIRKRTEQISIDQHPNLKMTVSIGTTFLPKGLSSSNIIQNTSNVTPEDQANNYMEHSFKAAIKRADTALFKAKRQGRNRVEHEE